MTTQQPLCLHWAHLMPCRLSQSVRVVSTSPSVRMAGQAGRQAGRTAVCAAVAWHVTNCPGCTTEQPLRLAQTARSQCAESRVRHTHARLLRALLCVSAGEGSWLCIYLPGCLPCVRLTTLCLLTVALRKASQTYKFTRTALVSARFVCLFCLHACITMHRY